MSGTAGIPRGRPAKDAEGISDKELQALLGGALEP
jgi:hypothetical protein